MKTGQVKFRWLPSKANKEPSRGRRDTASSRPGRWPSSSMYNRRESFPLGQGRRLGTYQ